MSEPEEDEVPISVRQHGIMSNPPSRRPSTAGSQDMKHMIASQVSVAVAEQLDVAMNRAMRPVLEQLASMSVPRGGNSSRSPRDPPEQPSFRNSSLRLASSVPEQPSFRNNSLRQSSSVPEQPSFRNNSLRQSSSVPQGQASQHSMMNQLMQMVEQRLGDFEQKSTRRGNGSSSRYYSQNLDDEDVDADLEDEDGRIAPYALSMLSNASSAVAWVKAQRCWDSRSLREALQWAALVDSFKAENLPVDSIALEIALRRLIGIHLSNLHSNWELAEVLEWSSGDSLLSRTQLNKVVKEANSRASLAKRAAGKKKNGSDGKHNGGHGGGHGKPRGAGKPGPPAQ